MNKLERLQHQRKARKRRVRMKIRGTADRPRLTVFRSNQHIYAQIINDADGKTLCSASDNEVTAKKATKMEIANKVGEILGKKAKDNKITKVCFDRGQYRFHGRIKALLEAVKESGVEV